MADKIKTLSQAMRLGATFRPQGFGVCEAFINPDGSGKSCAMVAAREAVYGKAAWGQKPFEIEGQFVERFPISTAVYVDVVIKNDRYRWTRELIAQWLEDQHGL